MKNVVESHGIYNARGYSAFYNQTQASREGGVVRSGLDLSVGPSVACKQRPVGDLLDHLVGGSLNHPDCCMHFAATGWRALRLALPLRLVIHSIPKPAARCGKSC